MNLPSEKNLGGVPENHGGRACVSTRSIQVDWQNECCKPSYTTSSTVLQTSPNSAESVGPRLQISHFISALKGGRSSNRPTPDCNQVIKGGL